MKLPKIIFILLSSFAVYAVFAFLPADSLPHFTTPSNAAMTTQVYKQSPYHDTYTKISKLSLSLAMLISVTPTSTPTPTPTPTDVPSVQEVQITSNSSMDAIATEIFQEINNFRQSHGLIPVQPNATVCSFAKTRVGEIVNNFNHKGFEERISSHSLPYANYSLVVENIAWNSHYKDVVPQWINSPGHAANMLANTVYGCVGDSGIYYVYEGMK